MSLRFWRRRPPAPGSPATTTTATKRPHPKGRPFATANGDWVRSGPEARIHNWLTSHGVPFQYEPRVLERLRPDFLVADRVIIEYWGGAGFRDYSDRMVKKTAAYEAAGYVVVHLLRVHLWELERELAARLADAGIHYGDHNPV